MKNRQGPHLESIRHSLAHVLAMAVLKKFPKAKLGIGPVIEHGFYYDFYFADSRGSKRGSAPITETDLPEIEQTMRNIIAQKLDFTGEKVTPQKARSLFTHQPFKLDLIKDFVKEKKQLTIYHTYSDKKRETRNKGEKTCRMSHVSCFYDLCRGGHVKNTSEINPNAFALTKTAGAYWRGDEKNPMLTRIYGLAFNTKEERSSHLALLEEAKRRDHKKLGPELGLFTFSELVGPGLPLWTPKGTMLRDVLDNFVWSLREKNGYERVDIPHIAKKDLYEKSGHWEKFQDEIFKIKSREGHIFVLKPMNCPHHTQIYASAPRSYKDLPIRYANTTKVYRDEQTGELSGLWRVRSITQDDAHVFCRMNQIQNEILKIWDMASVFYAKIGFSLSVRLSLRDPKNQKNYLGTATVWEKAEQMLRQLAKEKRADATEAIGEAAFYGPKIDFMAKDSLGRAWQVATIQLDMNLPERFDLSCTNEEGKPERIVMIHAAIIGSLERFIAVLIEHYAGTFPYWLAPVQVGILPINERVISYAEEIKRRLEDAHVRTKINIKNETIGKKIREAELQKIPYLLVIGDKEKEAGGVSVRKRHTGDMGAMPLEQFISLLDTETL